MQRFSVFNYGFEVWNLQVRDIVESLVFGHWPFQSVLGPPSQQYWSSTPGIMYIWQVICEPSSTEVIRTCVTFANQRARIVRVSLLLYDWNMVYTNRRHA